MALITKHISLLLSSDEANGATNKTADGSEFSVELDNENIVIPESAVDCNIWVQDAEYFFTFPNVLTDVNDKMRITYDNGVDPLFDYTLTIPQGLYSITDLDEIIQVLLLNQPGYPEASPLIELIGQDATQKVLIKYNYDGVRVDLTAGDTIRDLIGFDAGLYPNAGNSLANTFDTAQNVAAFNTLKYVLFSCDLCDNGFASNNRYDFYVCRSLIDKAVGQQIVYAPPLKQKLNASNLIGKKLSRTRVKLLDDRGQDVNTNNETYSIHVIIEYNVER
jgi:hypothetical protein